MLNKQAIVTLSWALAFVVLASLSIRAGEHGTGVSVTDVSGTTVDLRNFQGDELLVELSNKCSVRTPLSLVTTVRRKTQDSLAVKLSNGKELIGTIEGQISGESDLGRYSLPWSKVETVTFPEVTRPFFKKPSGLSAEIKMTSGETLQLSGILYVYASSEKDYSWTPPKPCVREYTYDCIDLMPVPKVYEHKIPLEWLRSLTPREQGYQLTIKLPDGSSSQVTGTIGNLYRTTHGHRLQGCDESGIWQVPIDGIASLTAHVPVTAYPKEARGVCVFTEYGVFTAKEGSTINGRPYAIHWDRRSPIWNGGLTCSVTLESGTQMRITHAHLSSLSVKLGESNVEVGWDKIKNVTFATTSSDTSENAQRKADLVLANGKTLSTTATFAWSLGFSGINKQGIPTSIRYNKIKAVEILRQD